MKKTSPLFFLCLLLLHLHTYAQQGVQPLLELSDRQTTSLVFPYPVLSVDRGSGDILAQVPKQATNVLQLKAARENFPATNLTVITADGKLYSLHVRYAAVPPATLVPLPLLQAAQATVLLPGGRLNEAQLESIFRQLPDDTRLYRGINDKSGGIHVALEGIYTTGSTLIYRLVLHNTSALPYELEAARFATRDRQQARRTASQEVKLLPYYEKGMQDAVVEAGASRILWFALERFPLGAGKEQVIELYEGKGSRHLTLRLHGRHLQRACPLVFN